MKPAKGIKYPSDSCGAKGIYSIPVTFKNMGFTEEEANEWRQYGVGAYDAIKLKSAGLSVAAIQMQGEWMEELLVDLGKGSILARMRLSEFAGDLSRESSGSFDADDWPSDGINAFSKDTSANEFDDKEKESERVVDIKVSESRSASKGKNRKKKFLLMEKNA
jgi:hypothetical protein